MSDGRDYTGYDNICKGHSARSDRDDYRICPSKLSKRELEDLYYRLIETNIQLKKTTNAQQDQLKLLSTRLQRATAQKSSVAKEKNCCATGKAVIEEQKYIIADLKKSNERLSDRIKLLNMRLCSARQFLKCSPPQCSSRCTKNCNFTNTSIKNPSMSALNANMSECNLKTKIVSCQYLDKESTPRKLDETLISQVKSPIRDTCDENKCKTLMEELKQKVTNLEGELFKTHEEYANRITKLEGEVSSLREDNARARRDQAAADQNLQLEIKQSTELVKKLRSAEAQCDDLAMELTIKEHKVRELETQLKAADISSHVAKALDDHFSANKIAEPTTLTIIKSEETFISPSKADKRSDDSGYAEQDRPLHQQEDTLYLDSEIKKQLFDLQSQLNTLKESFMESNEEKKYEREEASCSQKRVSLNMNQDLLEEKSTRRDSLKSANETLVLDDKHQSPRDENKVLNKVETYEEARALESIYQPGDTGDKDKHNIYQAPCAIPLIGNRRQSVRKNGHKVSENEGKIRKRKSSVKTSNDSRRSSKDDTKTNTAIKSSTEEEIYETNLNPSKVTCECPKDDALKTPNSDRKAKDTLKEIVNVVSNNKKPISDKETDISSVDDSLKTGKAVNKTLKNVRCKTYKDIAIQSIENTITKVCVNRGVGSDGLEAMMVKENKTANAEIQVAINDCRGVCKDATVETSVRRPCDKPLRPRAASNKRHRCECARYVVGDLASVKGQQVQQKGLGTAVLQAGSSPSHNTFVVQASTKLTRIRTPDNTENEISSLTDLPTERNSKSPEDYISPGEDRCISTLSETYTATITDYGSLSEGELPIGEDKHNMSYGEVKMKNKATGALEQSSSMQVEEALKEISKELARCRQLLHGQHFNKVITPLSRAVDPF